MVKVNPLPGSLSTVMKPLLCRTMPYTDARPRPVPFPSCLVVKNGSNRCERVSADIPTPSSQDFQSFTNALKKQQTVREALKGGTDFAEVAKANSDDADSKDKGGEIGWITRGMLADPRTEDAVFGTDAGNVSDAVTTSSQWTIYKVLEKVASKDVTDDQKAKIKQSAYSYWLERQKKAYDVQNVLPGFALR